MAKQSQTRAQELGKTGAEYRQKRIEYMAAKYGGRATEAVSLSPEEELEQYRKPTSPPARKVLEAGGSIEEAEQANAMWGHQLKFEQQMMREQLRASKAPPEAVLKALTDAGLTDELIFKATRGMAWELAKAQGKNDVAEETKYHERMVAKLAEVRRPAQTYQTVAPPTGRPPTGLLGPSRAGTSRPSATTSSSRAPDPSAAGSYPAEEVSDVV